MYLMGSHVFPLIAPLALRSRLRKGKEHPDRWREKLALNLAPRPSGPLVWLNAVGLGEVLSLRGLIESLGKQRSDLTFLVTSTTRASAEVFAANLPPQTIHQFLPIDAPAYRKRFLDHFQPDLCLWAEQDIWPGFVLELQRRCIPQAMVAARMNDASFQSHNKARGLYGDIYQRMALITTQDAKTAEHLTALGAKPVRCVGSLKPCAPPLTHDPEVLRAVQTRLGERTVWAVAPSHAEDEKIAIAAHRILCKTDPSALLIIVPRYPTRGDEIAANCPLSVKRDSAGELPDASTAIWLCDSFGKLGLIYRLARAVLIGGTFSDIEGHNPWEAITLQTAVFHGPRTANFAPDFAALHEHNAALAVSNAAELVAALTGPDLKATINQANQLLSQTTEKLSTLTTDLLALADRSND